MLVRFRRAGCSARGLIYWLLTTMTLSEGERCHKKDPEDFDEEELNSL